ncbi:hypothetical protein CDAR_243291 [Caerostris darwini]|uniref:Uncharacterized protein n=1 Tax=Caerostris darwini TaxID=1538125 RepID=A0AAV4MN93_9ARAC|nr:hypothetical protein CDAR_243291 [Caerostris darwini]
MLCHFVEVCLHADIVLRGLIILFTVCQSVYGLIITSHHCDQGKEQLEQQEVGGGNVAPSFSLSPSFCHQKLIPLGHVIHLFEKQGEVEVGVQEMKVRAVTVSDEGDVSDYLLSCFGKMNEIGLMRHATKDNASCVFPPRR